LAPRWGGDDSDGVREIVSTARLLRLKHDHMEIGFLSARVVRDDLYQAAWCLRVESPADLDEFRSHLAHGSSMDLLMVTREGDELCGEACVASVSGSADVATVVTLAGMGPLRSA
jgi:hypothetical protein